MAAETFTILRSSLDRFKKEKPSRAEILRRIDKLNFQIEQSLRFYPWPALIESLQRDVKALRALL